MSLGVTEYSGVDVKEEELRGRFFSLFFFKTIIVQNGG